jgi:ParB-like chromosome segregation protein Spo0J
MSKLIEGEIGLKNIPLDDIEFGDRRREDYGDINELASSIEDIGLICSIAVSIYDGDKPYLLNAGGRRTIAYELLRSKHGNKYNKIPCRIFDHVLDELELRTIEIEENVQRKDLSWDERNRMEADLMAIQEARHGKKVSTAKDAKGASIRSVAKGVGISASRLARSVKLDKTMKAMPDLGWEKCKTQADAMKLVKQAEKRLANEEAAKKVKAEVGDGDQRKKAIINSYIIKDCIEGMKELPKETFHLVEIDPPYAIDLKDAKASHDAKLAAYNEVEKDKYLSFMKEVLSAAYERMATNSWMILWFAPEPWFEPLYQLLTNPRDPEVAKKKGVTPGLGLVGNRICGYWTKGQGQCMQPHRKLASSVENFFYVRKGDPQLAKPGRLNEFKFPGVHPSQKIHPTERPLDLMSEILQTFVSPGSRVLVPFAGSGKTILASYMLDMTAVGFDLSESYRDAFIVNVNDIL